MKIAVVGASGFIGRHLCEAHTERGDSVTALVRNPNEALTSIGVTTVRGGLTDWDALHRICDGADVVYNLAGALGKWGKSTEELELVNTRAAGHLVVCAGRAGAAKVIHASTAGVSGPLPGGICAAEDYPPSPTTAYQRTKLAGESAASEAHRETGIPLVIVRPAFVYGPGDAHKLALFRAIARRRMALVNGGSSRLDPVYVDDVVRGLIAAAERGQDGETYILAGSPVTTRELIEVIAGALDVPPPKVSLPERVLLSVARISEVGGGIVGREPPLTCSRVKLLSENYAYCADKARRELGFEPSVGLTEGIARTVDWYRSRRWM